MRIIEYLLNGGIMELKKLKVLKILVTLFVILLICYYSNLFNHSDEDKYLFDLLMEYPNLLSSPNDKYSFHIVAVYSSKLIRKLREERDYVWPMFNISDNLFIWNFTWKQEVRNETLCVPKTGLPMLTAPLRLSDLNNSLIKPIFQSPILGGFWHPACKPMDKVAILVPYRRRAENLAIFLPYIHSYLQKQGIEYGIYVIEQLDNKLFNRAKLFNIGFVLSRLMHNYSCYVLQDIDKLPENPNFIYKCEDEPIRFTNQFREASKTDTAVKQFGRTRKYSNHNFYTGFFGAVSGIKTEQIEKINGFVNSFWGWGTEDDDIYLRLKILGFNPHYTPDSNSQFVVIYHEKDKVDGKRKMPLERDVRRRMKTDGLNSLQFRLDSISYEPLHTRIKAFL